jgi:hypothetical protein
MTLHVGIKRNKIIDCMYDNKFLRLLGPGGASAVYSTVMFQGHSSKSVLLVCRSDVKIVLSLPMQKMQNMTSMASNGQQRPSQLQPAMVDAGGNGPLVPHIRPWVPCRQHQLMWEDLPEQVHIFF